LSTQFKADLHTHSTFSDGTLSPKELVDLSVSQGFQGLSICDHDSIDSYAAAHEYAKKCGLKLIPGIEISCEMFGESVHILGYAYNPESSELKDFCRLHRERRAARNEAILQKLNEHGFELKTSDVVDPKAETITYGRPHIALAMVRKGYVKDIQEAFRKYIASGRPCYVAGERWKVEEAIDVIHRAQGLAVIAHPHLILRDKIVRELITKNFDGIEVFYCRFQADQCEYWRRIAQDKKWLRTGGSDFHGANKPDVTFGVSFVGQEDFDPIWNHFQYVIS